MKLPSSIGINIAKLDIPVNITPPSITGIGYVGQVLTASQGTWENAQSLSGQWYANNNPINNETGLTLTVSNLYDGAEFYYREIATSVAGLTSYANSNIIHHWIETDSVSSINTWFDTHDINNKWHNAVASNEIKSLTSKGRLPIFVVAISATLSPDDANSLNGLNTFTFDGTEYMNSNLDSLASFVHQGQSPITINVVGKSNSFPNAFISTTFGSADIGFGVRRNGSNNLEIFMSNGSTGQPVIQDTAPYPGDSNFHIFSFSLDPSNVTPANRSQIRIDGVDQPQTNTNSFNPSLDTSTAGVALATNGSGLGNIALNGEIASIFISNNNTEIEKLEGRVAHKYNLPLPPGHTFFSNPPNAPEYTLDYVYQQPIEVVSALYPFQKIGIVVKNNIGELLIFLEGRTEEGRADFGDNDLLVVRSSDGGMSWSDETVLVNFSNTVLSNLCPLVANDGTIHVVFCAGTLGVIDHESDRKSIWYLRSTDHGVTWTSPVRISDPWIPANHDHITVGPHKGIELVSGRLVFPVWFYETTLDRYAGVIYSDDGGTTWNISNFTTNTLTSGITENGIAQLGDGSLYMNARAQSPDHRKRVITRSTDNGLNWSTPVIDSTLLDPKCQGSVLSWDANTLLFCNVYNNQKDVGGNGATHNLHLKISYDNGYTWRKSKSIFIGEAGYSSMERDGDYLCITNDYTRLGDRVHFSKIPFSYFEGVGPENNIMRLVSTSNVSDDTRWILTNDVNGWSLVQHKSTGYYLATEGTDFQNLYLTQDISDDRARWRLTEDTADLGWYWLQNKFSKTWAKSDDDETNLIYMTQDVIGEGDKSKFQLVDIGGDTYKHIRHKNSNLYIIADS